MVLEYRNEAPEYVHSAWFMDTEGNEYRFVAKSVADDVMFKVLEDSQMNASEIERGARLEIEERRAAAALLPELEHGERVERACARGVRKAERVHARRAQGDRESAVGGNRRAKLFARGRVCDDQRRREPELAGVEPSLHRSILRAVVRG